MSVSSLLTPQAATAGYSPSPLVSTNGETFGATIDFMRTNMNSDSAIRMTGEEFISRNELVSKRFGKDHLDLTGVKTKYTNPSTEGRIKMFRESYQRLDAMILKGRQESPQQYEGIKTTAEVEEAAREKARMSKRNFEDVMSRNPSALRGVSSLAGGIVGGFTDPLNLITLPFGAGASSSILKAALAEGALNAAVEAATLPAVASWQKELGFKYGLGEMAADVGTAFVGGAGLTAVIRGAVPAFRKTMDIAGSASRYVLDKVASAERLPRSVRDAASYMSRVAHIDESAPPGMVKNEVELAKHRKTVAKVVEDFETYREPTAIQTVGEAPKLKDVPAGEEAPVTVADQTPEDISFRAEVPTEAIDIVNKYDTPEAFATEALSGKNKLFEVQTKGQLEKADAVTHLKDQLEKVEKRGRELADKLEGKKPTKELRDLQAKREQLSKDIAYAETGKSVMDMAGVKAGGDIKANKKALVDFYNKVKEKPKSPKSRASSATDTNVADMGDVAERPRAPTRPPEEIKAPDRLASKQATFKKLMDEEPDLKVTLEDGSTKSLKDLYDDMKGDLDVIEALTTCRIA